MVCGGFVLRVCTSSTNLEWANLLPTQTVLHLRYLRYLLLNTPSAPHALPVILLKIKYPWAVTNACTHRHTYTLVTIRNIWKLWWFCRWSTFMNTERKTQISTDTYLHLRKKEGGKINWHWCWCSFAVRNSPDEWVSSFQQLWFF